MPAGGTKKRKFKKTKPCNLRYKAEHRHEKGHIRRIAKHIKRYGDGDVVAVEALRLHRVAAGVRA